MPTKEIEIEGIVFDIDSDMDVLEELSSGPQLILDFEWEQGSSDNTAPINLRGLINVMQERAR